MFEEIHREQKDFADAQHALQVAGLANETLKRVEEYFRIKYYCETPRCIIAQMCGCWHGYDKDGKIIIAVQECAMHRQPVYFAELRDSFMIRGTWDKNRQYWLSLVKDSGFAEYEIPTDYWYRDALVAYEKRQLEVAHVVE